MGGAATSRPAWGKRARGSEKPRHRECMVVVLVTFLYLAICVHFVAPALSWSGLRPSGVLVYGDALNVSVVAGTVVLLPVFSLWSAWKAAAKKAKKLLEDNGASDG